MPITLPDETAERLVELLEWFKDRQGAVDEAAADRLLTANEAAALCRRSRRTFYRKVAPNLPCDRSAEPKRWWRSDVLAWLHKQKRPADGKRAMRRRPIATEQAAAA
jgi:predicted DNA-binding transcriptional regulator AlpA